MRQGVSDFHGVKLLYTPPCVVHLMKVTATPQLGNAEIWSTSYRVENQQCNVELGIGFSSTYLYLNHSSTYLYLSNSGVSFRIRLVFNINSFILLF